MKSAKWIVAGTILMTGLVGCVGTQDGQPLDEVSASLVKAPGHGVQDEEGAWHVDAGRLFRFKIEGELDQASWSDRAMVLESFSDEGKIHTTLTGAVAQAGRHELKTTSGASVWIEAHERDFERGPDEAYFGPLGQGERLPFDARSVRSVRVDRPDVTPVSSSKDGRSFIISAAAEGRSYVLIRSNSQVKLLTFDVLPAGEVPASARKIVELKKGESWSGISATGVKSMFIGLDSVMSVEPVDEGGRQVLRFTAKGGGVTPVSFTSEYDERTTIWFRVLGGSNRSANSATAMPHIIEIDAPPEEKKEVLTSFFLEVEYVKTLDNNLLKAFRDLQDSSKSAAQAASSPADSPALAKVATNTFTLKQGESLAFSKKGMMRIIIEDRYVQCEGCEDNGLKLTLKGTKQGVAHVLFVSDRGEAQLIALNVVAKE